MICEYLNNLGGGKFFPGMSIWRSASGRWKALTLQALGDGMADAAVARVYETRRPQEQQSAETIARYTKAVSTALDVLERAQFAKDPTIGEIAVGCAHRLSRFSRGRCPAGATRGPASPRGTRNSRNYPSMRATAPANLT